SSTDSIGARRARRNFLPVWRRLPRAAWGMSPCATVVRSATASGEARFGGRELLALVLPARVELLELARGVAVSGDQRRAAGGIGEERRVGELRFRRFLLLLQLGDALLQLGDGALDRSQDPLALLALGRALSPGLHDPRALPAGEHANALLHLIAGEEEGTEHAPDPALGLGGNQPVDLLEDGPRRVEALGVVLREIPGDHVVPERHDPRVGLDLPRQQ